MKTNEVYPSPPAGQLADWTDVAELQRRMAETVEAMQAMVGQVAVARQIKEYNGEQRKRVLAVASFPLIKAGGSATASETEAKAGEPYRVALEQLGKQLVTADETLLTFDVLKVKWETCRSLLVMQREGLRQL
jgi:hypothetical protein